MNPTPTWSRELLPQVHSLADKAQRVRATFAAIAGRYDLNNRLHSLWRDQAWRRAAVRAAEVQPGDAVLDVATGTGDLAGWFARLAPAGRIVGVDFCRQMLAIAARKFARLNIVWREADALELPFDDASFDVVAAAFGVRNVQEPARALAEMYRVCRKAGRIVVLEFADPTGRGGRLLRLYTHRILPLTAGWIAGDRWAYRYLSASIGAFMSAEALAAAIAGAGFADIRTKPTACGLAALHVGGKP
jgi:demethylmenaquinone methyltransferase/2-methoxy-6-polyprenyl-1,4-benzoquinol methylase